MVQLQKTKKEFEGHLTLVVFPFLKMSKKGPEQTAQEIGEYLKQNEPAIANYNVIKGFLNLTIASDVWIELLNRIHTDNQWGIQKADDNAPLVMIEYSSPNTNKPLHLGHVRNNLLGSALANIMAANGNKVVKTNIVNDRGIHICKSMLAWLKYGNGETPESSGKKGDHLIGDYYVAFDKHYKAEVKELMAQYQAEGMNEEEAKAKAEANSPLMLEAREMLRKWEANDPEVRALWKKMNDWVYAGFDETYKMMGVSFDKIYYESQTYDLMEAMIETAKETSNELGKLDGLTQEEADDIARIVGLGALKYFILKVDARKNMTFNPKESIDFNGNTGPFIQYTYARIQSILRKATEAGLSIPAVIPSGIELSTKEEGLIQMLADFTNVVKQAGTDYNPSILANYAYDLVKEYNQFYHDFSILREENEALKIFRLALSQNVGKVVKLAMGLLGIEVPERM